MSEFTSNTGEPTDWRAQVKKAHESGVTIMELLAFMDSKEPLMILCFWPCETKREIISLPSDIEAEEIEQYLKSLNIRCVHGFIEIN